MAAASDPAPASVSANAPTVSPASSGSISDFCSSVPCSSRMSATRSALHTISATVAEAAATSSIQAAHSSVDLPAPWGRERPSKPSSPSRR